MSTNINRLNFKTENLSAIATIVIVLSGIVLGSYYKKKEINLITRDYKIAKGKIISYNDSRKSVEGTARAVKYSYQVDGQNYFGSLKSYVIEIDECVEVTSEACKNKRFWVIYSRLNPAKSLINLEIEIDSEHSEFPRSLTDFR